jgi:hypothetical protein
MWGKLEPESGKVKIKMIASPTEAGGSAFQPQLIN